MKKFKSLNYIVSCLFAFVLSFVLSGCSATSHSHGHTHGHDHGGHSHSPHHGIVAPLMNSNGEVGSIELKLHDDKGDLELWLTSLQNNTPFDLPLNSSIKVIFFDLASREVSLKARNNTNNEDEDGNANIRNGKTNYFIFPGDTPESAQFLVGKDFSAIVGLSFVVNGEFYKTAPFVLTPHTH